MRILIMSLLLLSCGKNSTGKTCKTRTQKVYECITQHVEAYGEYYSNQICNQNYRNEGCYQ